MNQLQQKYLAETSLSPYKDSIETTVFNPTNHYVLWLEVLKTELTEPFIHALAELRGLIPNANSQTISEPIEVVLEAIRYIHDLKSSIVEKKEVSEESFQTDKTLPLPTTFNSSP